jgi:GNAT superfamily N-acetyltransferase
VSVFARPRPLDPGDSVTGFDCGEPSLNEWLSSRAIKNEATGASRSFVSVDRDTDLIAGYYCLSASSLLLDVAPGKLRRNMPSPIPVILLGRLAVDERFKGTGLGASLLQDAVLKSIEAAQTVGAHAIIVDALNSDAASFYRRFGFEPMPAARDGAMFLLVSDAEATVKSTGVGL